MTLRVTINKAIRLGWIKPESSGKKIDKIKHRSIRKIPNNRKRDTEGEEQILLIEQFRNQHEDIGELLIHIPNGGSRRNAFEGWRLKRQGVRAGVSDLFLPVARGGYFGCWVEFKAQPPYDARLTESQIDWIDEMRCQGYQANCLRGVDSALTFLTEYVNKPKTQAIKQ